MLEEATSCLHEHVRERALRAPDAAAILSPGRRPLTYGGLRRQVDEVVRALNARGIGRGDRVAMVLPDGPEAAVASIAVAAGATCAPLDPALRARELDVRLTHLRARALLVPRGSESPAVALARSRGMAVLELIAEADGAGTGAGAFALAGEGPPPRRRPHPDPLAPARAFARGSRLRRPQPACRRARGLPGGERDRLAEPDDTALALHTSGTAARPKLVPLSHRNLSASARSIADAVELSEADLCLDVMPLFHIHGLSLIFASLAAGGGVICPSAGFTAARFFEWLRDLRPTWYSAAPAIHQTILESVARYPEVVARSGLRFIRSASAPMPRHVMEGLERAFAAPFIEAYGMTEAAPQIASNRLPPRGRRKAGSVGTAAGPGVAIMDEAGRLRPPGARGEVVIRGANVMRAYEDDPAANEAAFTGGWLRTGDEGYLDPEGHLFITGRLKEIINRGGEKISPREVDEVLMGHPAVAEAVAFAVPHPVLGEDVAAAVVLKPGEKRRIQEIRDFAATCLAPFKVPQRIVVVSEIPRGPTGKLRRIDLGEKVNVGEAEPEPVSPRTPAERRVAEIWAEVLGIDPPGVNDDFFLLGGHSLAATQVVARLGEVFAVDLSIRCLFETPTVAGLAELIGRRMADLVAEGRARLTSQSETLGRDHRERAPACRAHGTSEKISSAQQRLWFLDRLGAGAAYNLSASSWLEGPLDEAALAKALDEIRRRHETLRTTFRLVGERPVATVAPPGEPTSLPVVDLTALPSPQRPTEALRLAAEEASRPFDLERGPLLRATLLRLGQDEHALLLTMHHIIGDGWSRRVLYRELRSLYEAFAAGRASPLPELPVQFADFAAWQHERLRATLLEDQIAYWRRQLRDIPPALELPRGRPRPAVQTYRGSRLEAPIPRRVTEELAALGRRANATPFMTHLAAFQTLLLRATGQADCVVGVPIAGRTRVDTEALIGFFASTLVLRTDLAGDPTFEELIARVRATALGAYAHQDVPFEELVERLQPRRDPSRTPLFQVMFAFQEMPDAEPAGGLELGAGLTARPFAVDNGTAKFDLTLYLAPTEQGMLATWQYNADLFEAATIERLAGCFETLLEGVAADPGRRLSELPLLAEAERRRVEVEWNRTDAPALLEGSFHRLFESQARRTPDAIAVECGADDDGRLTYRELNERANRLARYLRTRGVGPEALVGIRLDRSVELVVAVVAVLKAGGAYLALDPEYPAERTAFMLEDARASVLVTRSLLETDRDAIAGQSAADQDGDPAPANLAYVIYTSGSTGLPKGVMITHGNLGHYVQAMREALGIAADDRYLHTASFAFSSSVRQLALPLSCGAAVVVAPADRVRDPEALLELIRDRRVSVLDIVPSCWRSLIEVLRSATPASRAALLENALRLIVSASEPLPADLPEQWASGFRHPARLVNMFGQTETTGIVALYPIPVPVPVPAPDDGGDAPAIVPVGRPIANTRVYVLDGSRRPVPVGFPGEAYVGGAGVGRGYRHRPELTAERFVPDPFGGGGGGDGARLYRTGDIARYRPDGSLEIIGRADQQVKVRGHRVEPAEVEAVLARHPRVRECAVVGEQLSRGDTPLVPPGQRLVAYVVPREAPATPDEPQPEPETELAVPLRGLLKRKLPEYMVPSSIVELAALPRTQSGKVDRKALSARSGDGSRPARALASPRTPAESALAEIWKRVLRVPDVGVDDNFFDLGGDSLLCVQVIVKAQRAGLRLRLEQLFQHQTVAELARAAAAGEASAVGEASDASKPREGSEAREGAEPSAVLVTVESLRAYGREALERAGLAAEGARIVAEVQLEASLRGQPTHDMVAIPHYARRIAQGLVNRRPRIRIERETAVSARIDGDDGPGPWVAVVAMETAIRKAREGGGVGIVSARRSNHFGAAGHYAWLAARQGLIGLCTTNGPPILAPTGGRTPTFGSNPLGVGIPGGRHHPILLDIAMSVAPRGKIGLHVAEGKPLPPGWILDRLGRPSTDVADLAAGLGVPIGGHKGYGLALVMEALAGALTGAGLSLDRRRDEEQDPARGERGPADVGHFFLAIDPELFLPLAELASRVDRLIERTKSGERAEGVAEILVPGEAELRARERCLREGVVTLRPSTYRTLTEYARAAGLETQLVTL